MAQAPSRARRLARGAALGHPVVAQAANPLPEPDPDPSADIVWPVMLVCGALAWAMIAGPLRAWAEQHTLSALALVFGAAVLMGLLLS